MASSRSRLLIEVREAQRSPDPDIQLTTSDDNLHQWRATLHGPSDSPYEGGIWEVCIICPSNYPISPPSVTFRTPCFHPNVNFATGKFSRWSELPVMTDGEKRIGGSSGVRHTWHTCRLSESLAGEVCLDVLKSNWSPAWTVQFLCRALIALLADPNADSPLNCDAGNLVRNGDMRGFNSMARMYTKEFAAPKNGP